MNGMKVQPSKNYESGRRMKSLRNSAVNILECRQKKLILTEVKMLPKVTESDLESALDPSFSLRHLCSFSCNKRLFPAILLWNSLLHCCNGSIYRGHSVIFALEIDKG